MTTNPDQLRAQIEQTRGDLSANVSALGEAVKPSHVARHQVEKFTSGAAGLKDRVMGSAHDTIDAGADAGSGWKDTAAAVPGQVKNRTTGNPSAMGLIAIGAGWLVGSVIPATERESQLATAVKDHAQPPLDEAQSAAQESIGRLQEPAQEAAESVASRAQEATENVKAEAEQATAGVKDTTDTARHNVPSLT